jgi:hypothetical protein
MKSSFPVNCLWGSARSSQVAPVHFWPPIGRPVSSLHIRAPFQIPRGPPAEGSVHSEVSCHRGELPWGSARSSREGPHPLLATIYGPVSSSPRACAGPKAAAVKDEGVVLPAKLCRAQHAVILLPDPRQADCVISLSAHVQLNVPDTPTSSCCARSQSE